MSNSFKSLLEQSLNANELSISKLASMINVDRTWLQHALAGRRVLGYDNLEKIINCLNLTETFNSNLREAFAKEYFEKKDYEIIKNSLSKINAMHKYEASIKNGTIKNDHSSLCEIISEQYCTNSNQKECFSNIYNIVLNELNKDAPTFYTNYSMFFDCIRTLFLNILSTFDKYIAYNHIIFNERANDEQYVLDMFLYQNEFAGYGYNTYTINNDSSSNNISIFPYFLATNDCYIIFSEDLECFIVSNDDAKISYIKNKYIEHLENADPFSHFMRNSDDFSLFVSLINHKPDDFTDYAYDLSENLCLAAFLDADILKEAIPDQIELKEYFIHGISEYYKATSQIPTLSMFSTESLLNFVNNDSTIADYRNVTFDILQISPQSKLRMLKKLSEQSISQSNAYYIINTKKLHFPSYFHTYMFRNSTLSFNFRIYDPTDCNKYIGVCCNRNPIVYKHLRNIAEYIIHSTNLYSNSKEYATTHINSAIAYYNQRHNLNE